MQKPPQTGELLPFDLQDILFFLWFKIRPAESPQPCLNQFHENGNCRDLQRVWKELKRRGVVEPTLRQGSLSDPCIQRFV